MDHMIAIWLIAMVVFGVTEAMTTGLVCIWFALGALGALLVALLGGGLGLQIVAFLLVSALSLALTRPLLKKYGRKATPTNADRLLGSSAKVLEAIDNEKELGAVYAGGKTWTARSADGSPIPQGESVLIEALEGVKLIVTRK